MRSIRSVLRKPIALGRVIFVDYTILEGGMSRFVKWDKENFVGKIAMENERQQGVKKQFVSLIVDAGEYDPLYVDHLA